MGTHSGSSVSTGGGASTADAAVNGDDGIVEIVIIPVAGDPSRVGGIGERERRETDEQDSDQQRENATREQHEQ